MHSYTIHIVLHTRWTEAFALALWTAVVRVVLVVDTRDGVPGPSAPGGAIFNAHLVCERAFRVLRVVRGKECSAHLCPVEELPHRPVVVSDLRLSSELQWHLLEASLGERLVRRAQPVSHPT
jgi:hypothetical protein